VGADVKDKLRPDELYAWKTYADFVGDTANIEDFHNRYQGEYASREAWAEHALKEDGVPQNLIKYFDLTAYVNDVENENHSFVDGENGRVYVFTE
jgi:antirestriction protein